MINSFRNEYSFLSNFAWINLNINGKIWPTSEHMFIACKTTNPTIQEAIRCCKTPGAAKQLGRKIQLRSDWEQIKNEAMLRVLRRKFQLPEMKQKLLATGTQELVEGNYWHDNYWGSCLCKRCKNKGKNTLGKILMQIREELR